MENLEKKNLIPESDPTPAIQPEPLAPEAAPTETEAVLSAAAEAPETTAAEPVAAEPNYTQMPPWEAEPVAAEPVAAEPVAEQAPQQEPAPARPEWGYGMAFPPKQATIHTPPKATPAAPKKARGSVFKPLLAFTLVTALVITGCFFTGAILNGYWSGENLALQKQISVLQTKLDQLQGQIQTPPTGNISPVPTPEGYLTPSQVYAQNVDAVVTVSTNTSTGSGFILTADGYVITNYHVVEGSLRIDVSLSDSTNYSASMIGYDANRDMAVLKINATGLPHVTLGSSDALAVGDQITVIGNPLGKLTYTQSVGYISGKDRDVSSQSFAVNMLQTDASINSGNSGGPMFNMKGQVVGIITSKYSGTSSSGASIEGVGFAIPIDEVAPQIYELIEKGYISSPYLGVSVRDMDAQVSQAFGIPMGAYVASVEPNNCAFAAGVREKDVITALGDHSIRSLKDLTMALEQFKPGDTTTIQVWRSGQTLSLTITLDEKPH